ncbi:MAG: transketolase [Burkholderiales bacterium]|jgi:transketolase|nr:transketolase [Burkholderiales bacterium]
MTTTQQPQHSSPISTSEMANSLRFLAADAIEAAKSGHPGMPLGMAEIAVALWKRHLKHNPHNPSWADRDRFILSNGHGSMLQYALLHLTGYDLSVEDLKNFRQLHSKTPGHPEVGITPGVETSTGPLGQGLANAVGMALAEKMLAAKFNKHDLPIVNHFTYVFLGDGCLMEGISHEAASLAGTWGLGKLIAFYDDNGISIDGKVSGWMTDDTVKRFEAYGWHVIPAVDGHNVDAVDWAIRKAQMETEMPSLICCKTTIGKGSPHKAGTAATHGAPLGKAEIDAMRELLRWTYPPFEIPQKIYEAWDARQGGNKKEAEWSALFKVYEEKYPELAREFQRRLKGDLPDEFAAFAQAFLATQNQKAENIATRKASQQAIEAYAPHLPELVGGSADLTGSVFTNWSGSRGLTEAGEGNYLYYGVREFAMFAIANGLTLHGGFIPYAGTFLTFSDYARNALRMAALMKKRVIAVLTHDSIGLGEDGPTHQSIEHVSSLRMIPNMRVWRPCDTVETAVAWREAIMRHDGPTSLVLSRQNLPFVPRKIDVCDQIVKGGYVLLDFPEISSPCLVLLATGSEIELAIRARTALVVEGIAARVVSMPCAEAFDAQSDLYKQTVLPSGIPRLAIEAGVSGFWSRYVGAFDDKKGDVIGIDTFGESAPAPVLFDYFGLTVNKIIEKAKVLLG